MNNITKISFFTFTVFTHYLSFGMIVVRNSQPVHRVRFQDTTKQASFNEARKIAFDHMREG